MRVGGIEYARWGFDVGLLTDRPEPLLDHWTGDVGFPVERVLEPVPGVRQHKLTMHSAVLKVNAVGGPLPARAPRAGVRMLLLADDTVDSPLHRPDPDGNLVCFVPPGFAGVERFGVHLAVSDEAAHHRFLAEVLGAPQVGERTYLVAGAPISFSWSPDVVPGNTGVGAGYTYLTLQVVDVHAAHETLVGRGAVELQAPSGERFASDSIVSFVADPDGNRIEISQRPDLVAALLRSDEGGDADA
jgi:lactoylglutathione lyase